MKTLLIEQLNCPMENASHSCKVRTRILDELAARKVTGHMQTDLN
ncbi:hypothetical protein BOMU111920_16775 [Bordetella muralis]